MNEATLKFIAQVAGVGGIAIALAISVFREIIRKKIFPNLTKQHAYNLLRLIVILATVIGLAGLAAWVFVVTAGRESPEVQLRKKADAALAVPASYSGSASSFLRQPGTYLFRIHPRESNRMLEAAGINGGGSYYSFLRRSHEYGSGNELGYESGSLYTGFAGADYGYLLMLGDIPVEKLVAADPAPPSWLDKDKAGAWEYLWTYRPPSDIKEIRHHQRLARGLVIGGSTLSERAAAVEGMSYLLRSILIGEEDVLIALRVNERLDDGSLIIAGKMLKLFPTPVSRTEQDESESVSEEPRVNKTYVVHATASGTVFDDDSGPFGSSDESDNYSWGWEIPLAPGGPVETRDGEKCVDNEVQLRVNASFSMDLHRAIHVTVHSQLFEGDGCGQELEAEKNWEGAIEAGQARDIINERIADDQGDWGTFVLHVENPPE